MTNPTEFDDLLTTHEAAQYLGISAKTLEGYRNHRIGPLVVRKGASLRPRVYYRRSDLESWRRRCASDAAPSTTVKQLLTAIALHELGIYTLEQRGSDRQDFHEVSVWSLSNALLRGYNAGQTTTTAPAR